MIYNIKNTNQKNTLMNSKNSFSTLVTSFFLVQGFLSHGMEIHNNLVTSNVHPLITLPHDMMEEIANHMCCAIKEPYSYSRPLMGEVGDTITNSIITNIHDLLSLSATCKELNKKFTLKEIGKCIKHNVDTLLVTSNSSQEYKESYLHWRVMYEYAQYTGELSYNMSRGFIGKKMHDVSYCRNTPSLVLTALIHAGANISQAGGLKAGMYRYGLSNNGNGNKEVTYICNPDVMKLFIKMGQDINETDRFGRTLLYIMSEINCYAMVKSLIELGADINKTNHSEETPLYVASEKNNIAVLKLLIQAGADMQQTNNNGYRPLDIANKNCHAEVVELLTKYSKGGYHKFCVIGIVEYQ